MAAFDTLFAASAAPLLHHQFGDAVTLRRGVNQTDGVTADWDQAEFEQVKDRDIVTLVSGRTWYIDKSSYTFDGTEVDPRPGDILTDPNGANWQIMPSGDSHPVRDTGSGQWAVDTKRV